MTWQAVGSISVGPNDLSVQVGSVNLVDGADTLWVRVTQQGGDSPWPYGFGLLSWKTTDGRDLGTAKIYGHTESETYRLGVGLPPVERGGVLWFEPRSYNLRWLKVSGAVWSLSFDVQSGSSGGGGGGSSIYAGSFVSTTGTGLELLRVVFP